jgi:hypothetical protein
MRKTAISDPDLLVRLAHHLDGVAEGLGALSQLVAALVSNPPPRLGEENAAYESVSRFLSEKCARDTTVETSAIGLYHEFRKWAGQVGMSALTQKRFAMVLAGMGVPKRRTKTGVRYLGIGLRRLDVAS